MAERRGILTLTLFVLEITLTEGRNRHVHRMTATTGHPTLRLVRVSMGTWSLDGLLPGEWEVRASRSPTLALRS